MRQTLHTGKPYSNALWPLPFYQELFDYLLIGYYHVLIAQYHYSNYPTDFPRIVKKIGAAY